MALESNHNYFLAIDPGANGALCILTTIGTIHSFIDFKHSGLKGYIAVINELPKEKIRMAAIEAVSAMPGQGVKSMFSFGQRLGELEGMLQTMNIGYELVRPQQWMKSCQITAKTGKTGNYDVISKIYPLASLIGPKGGIQDGRVDALGIAHHLRKAYSF